MVPNTSSCENFSVAVHWHILISFTGGPALLFWGVENLFYKELILPVTKHLLIFSFWYMIQDEQSPSNFHIVYCQLSKQPFGKSPFSGGLWCVASAGSSGRWTPSEAQQEAQREWDLSQPKAVPDTDQAGKHISPFCWDLYWNILVLTAHNLLTQLHLFEIELMGLLWNPDCEESIFQQLPSLH